ncbi:MAG TPA: M56 family metallopeptidase, partial [Rhodothermales bacterium]|nr:M56 family metallopeptidase [Rhodothermales bacterium]
MLSALSQQLGIRQNRVMLATIPTETVPMTFGWRRPMIVLPASLLETPLEAEMAIFHELVHIRRHDFVWNWVERVLNLAFWFHPLMYLIRNRIAQAREQVCDTTVLSIGCYPAEAYARLLFQLSATPAYRPALQMADTFMSLKARLETMKETVHSQNHIQRANRLGHMISFAFLILTTIALAGTKFHEPEKRLSATTQINMTTEDCTLSFENGQISLYDNEDLEVEATYRSHKGFCSGIILHPQTGLIRFSTVPFLNARKAGSVSNGLLRLSIDGFQASITSRKAILENPNRQPLYVARYPYIQPESWRNNRPEGSFERFSDPLWYFGLEAEMPPEEEENAHLTIAGFQHIVIFSPRMVNGKPVSRHVFTTNSLRDQFIFWYVEGIGRIVFSETKFNGATLTGEADGKNLILRYDQQQINVSCEHNLFRDRRKGQLWVRIDPNPKQKHSGVTHDTENIDNIWTNRGRTNNLGTYTTEEDKNEPTRGFPSSSGNTIAYTDNNETSRAHFAESPTDINLSNLTTEPSDRLSRLKALLEQQNEQLQWENYQAQDFYNQYQRANAGFSEQMRQYGMRINQKQSGLLLLQSQLEQHESLYARGKATYSVQRLHELEQRIQQLHNEIEALKRHKPQLPASRSRSSNSGSSRGNGESGNASVWPHTIAETAPAWPSSHSDHDPASAPSGVSGSAPARTLNGQRVAQPVRGTSIINSNGYAFVCEAGNDCSVTT